jgi:beta-galactosidase
VFPGGVFDMAGFRKPDAWWRQALWTETPMVYLAATQRPPRGEGRRGGFRRRGGELLEHWNWSDASPVRVSCATNCPTVDLYLNGELVATLAESDDSQGWRRTTVEFAPGKLEAVGRDGAREFARFALQTAAAPHRVSLEADASQLDSDGRDIAHVTFTIVDERGVRVPDANHDVTFTIDGPVRLLGIENGRTDGDPKYQDEHCEANRGRGLAIFQATHDPGEAVIRATAMGLDSAELRLSVR